MENSPGYGKKIILLAFIAILAGILVYKYVLQDSPLPSATQNFSSSTSSSTGNDPGILQPQQDFNIDPQKPVWLLFRSATCVPCVAMQKTMEELRPEFEGKVQFISIDVNDSQEQQSEQQIQSRIYPRDLSFRSQPGRMGSFHRCRSY